MPNMVSIVGMTDLLVPPQLCACGCGQPVPPTTPYHKQPPRYIHGHGSRDPEVKARRTAAHRRWLEAGRPPVPVYRCQCGCGEVIPPKPSHRYAPPRFIPGHFQRVRGEAFRQALLVGNAKRRLSPPRGWIPPSGLCECGCGGATPLARTTVVALGQYKGYPMRFLHGHNMRLVVKEKTRKAMERRRIGQRGYVYLLRPEHPAATKSGYVLEHRVIYEESRGVRLPAATDVHHINGDKTDNRPENLIALAKVEHKRAHALANGVVSLFLDDKLLEAAKAHVREHGTLPDLEALTAEVYGHH